MITLFNNTNPIFQKIPFPTMVHTERPRPKINNLERDTFCLTTNTETDVQRFKALRDNFETEVQAKESQCSLCEWNFNINLSDDNAEKLSTAEEERKNLYKNRELYKKFLSINKNQLSKREQKQLNSILRNFKEELTETSCSKELKKKLAETQQKYIKVKNTNEYLIIKDLKELVELRNKYAKEQGYDNYYDMMLEDESETSFETTEKLFTEFKQKAGTTVKKLKNTKTKTSPIIFKTPQDIVMIAKDLYSKMGVDIDKLVKDGKLTLDLYPKKNKSELPGCYTINNDDVRITASINKNLIDFEGLCHELGHSLYELAIDKNLPITERKSHWALSEAIAMLFEDLHINENLLDNSLSPKAIENNKAYRKSKKAKDISDMFAVSYFEREMYKNPNQDLKVLWANVQKKYGFESKPQKGLPDAIEHFIIIPGASQNYLRGKFMQAQLYAHLREKFGKISQSTEVVDYLRNNIFKYGTSISEEEIIKNLTGKPLSVDALIAELK